VTAHMYVNAKMIPTPRMGEGGDKEEWWREWTEVWYIWYSVRTFINATMYPPSSTIIKTFITKKKNE
jgi:hypothetical protein